MNYCTANENSCRRMLMLALGASENHPESLPCCDSCDSSKCPPNLLFETQGNGYCFPTKEANSIQGCKWRLQATLRTSLIKAVDEYMEINPSFQMLDCSFVCPDFVIGKICSEACFIKSEHDLNFVEICLDLKNTFYIALYFLMLKCTSFVSIFMVY